VIAWIDVSARYHPVNLSDNVAVTKVELGLIEIAVGGVEFGLRLLDGRCIRRQSSKPAVDIALIQALELLDHLLRQLIIRMDNAELRRRLNESGLRLADGRESLIEIGWHLSKVSASRLRLQAQRDADLMDIRHRLRHFRLRYRYGRLPPIIFLLADRCR